MIFVILLNIIKSPATKLLITAFIIGAIATGGVYYMNYKNEQNKQKIIEETLASLTDKFNKKNYEKCLEEAESEEIKTKEIPEEKRLEFITQCRLGAGQQQADLLEYEKALEIVKEIPIENPNYKQVEAKIDEWSYQILKNANTIYDKGCNLEEALALTIAIPQSSPVYKLMEIQREKWKKDYDYNQPLIQQANNALELENYQQALNLSQQVNGANCWLLEAKKIGEKVAKEAEKNPNNQSNSTSSQSSNNQSSQPQEIPCPPGVVCTCPGALCPDNKN